MLKSCCLFILIICTTLVQGQSFHEKDIEPRQDTIKKKELLKSIGNGFLPSKYFNLDLRYLIKFNQYEGVRTGLGGVTNSAFSEKYPSMLKPL